MARDRVLIMNFVYSASNNMFYPYKYQPQYINSGDWPDDAIDVDDSVFFEYTGKPPEGKQRGANAEGFPEWVDIPAPTDEEIIAGASYKKQSLIEKANGYMNDKQWPGKAALGRLTEAEKDQYNLWLDYLDALDAVDTSSVPDIDWPVAPAE